MSSAMNKCVADPLLETLQPATCDEVVGDATYPNPDPAISGIYPSEIIKQATDHRLFNVILLASSDPDTCSQ
jgi:hypothetical protein